MVPDSQTESRPEKGAKMAKNPSTKTPETQTQNTTPEAKQPEAKQPEAKEPEAKQPEARVETPLEKHARLTAELKALEAAAAAQREAKVKELRDHETSLAAQHAEAMKVAKEIGEKLLAVRSEIRSLNGGSSTSSGGGQRERQTFGKDTNGRDFRLPPAGTKIENTKFGVHFLAYTTETSEVIGEDGTKYRSVSEAARKMMAAVKGKETQVDGFLAFGLK